MVRKRDGGRHARVVMRAIAAASSLLLVLAVGVSAQSEEASEAPPVDAPDIMVVGVEYAFEGLPTSVPAGTSLGFTNPGAEVHMMSFVRINDDITASLEELAAMPGSEDPVSAGMAEAVGGTAAPPGETSPEIIVLDREGRYVAVCIIPQGATDLSMLEAMSGDPSEQSPEVQALLSAPTHVDLGMLQEFWVTAADSTPGPMPEAAAGEESSGDDY